MVLTYEVSTKTSSACNELLLEQNKCILDIKENQLAFITKVTLIIIWNKETLYIYNYQTSIFCISTAA